MFTLFQYHTGSQKSLCFRLAARCFLAAVIVAIVSACGSYRSDHVYKLYPGQELPDSDVATLKFGNGVYIVEIDDLRVSAADYGAVKLLPGVHTIRWEATFMVSVMVNASGFDRAELENGALLSAGHTYILEADRTTGHGYRMYLWIEDAKTGEVVAGVRKP